MSCSLAEAGQGRLVPADGIGSLVIEILQVVPSI